MAWIADRRLASVGTTGLTSGQSTSFAFTTDVANEITGTTQTSEAPISSPTSALSQSATYNNLNQLTNLSGQALTFDADGNLTSDGTRTYTWDAENRLVAIAYPGQGAKATAFSYDGLGRRIQITSTPARGSAIVTDYLWCGQRLCQARNSANAVTRGYYAEGEIKVGTPSVSDYYASDQLGSVRRVFTSTTAPSYDYDAYGQALQTAPALTNYGFAGMVINADSGLYLTTARPYDPVTGRFLTRDPIGEAGDPEANLYAYVGGDPVNLTDPEGLCAKGPKNNPNPCPPGSSANTSGAPDYKGIATEYGQNQNGTPDQFAGQRTASGDIMDPTDMTAASVLQRNANGAVTRHPLIPLGTNLVVVYGGTSVGVTINDTGPLRPGRILDLSPAAMKALTGKSYNQVPVGAYICRTSR